MVIGGANDNIQNALKAADAAMANKLDFKYVELNSDVQNDVTIDNVKSEDNALNAEVSKAGNGSGFYVKDGDKWHNVSNLAGGQWFQLQMETITKGAQNAATGISTGKTATETIKRAYS